MFLLLLCRGSKCVHKIVCCSALFCCYIRLLHKAFVLTIFGCWCKDSFLPRICLNCRKCKDFKDDEYVVYFFWYCNTISSFVIYLFVWRTIELPCLVSLFLAVFSCGYYSFIITWKEATVSLSASERLRQS